MSVSLCRSVCVGLTSLEGLYLSSPYMNVLLISSSVPEFFANTNPVLSPFPTRKCLRDQEASKPRSSFTAEMGILRGERRVEEEGTVGRREFEEEPQT